MGLLDLTNGLQYGIATLFDDANTRAEKIVKGCWSEGRAREMLEVLASMTTLGELIIRLSKQIYRLQAQRTKGLLAGASEEVNSDEGGESEEE